MKLIWETVKPGHHRANGDSGIWEIFREDGAYIAYQNSLGYRVRVGWRPSNSLETIRQKCQRAEDAAVAYEALKKELLRDKPKLPIQSVRP